MGLGKTKIEQVIERIETILKGIDNSGGSYYYTVREECVVRGLRVWREARGYPFLMVYLGSDSQPVEYHPDKNIFIYPTIIVAAYVDKEGGEPITKMLRVLRDVRMALESDIRSGESGSLGQLAEWIRLGSVATDEGELALDGLAGFRLEVNMCICGDYGDF